MGKPGKLKSGTGKKGKKWSKGNSSSSNPASFKHRHEARSKFFHMQPTSSSKRGLTSEALKLHNELESGNALSVLKPLAMDETSESAQTFGTFLSGVSDCTNLTFGKIQKYWLKHSAQHKEVCAVLAAITEVIRQHNGDESDTAYFAALITALSSVEQVESAAAVAYLLAMTVKKVPPAVLCAKFGEVSKLLTNILVQYSSLKDGDMPAAYIKPVISTLAVVLRNQEKYLWKDPSTIHAFHALLDYIACTKPKIRKSAQNAVCSILLGSLFMIGPDSLPFHPAVSATGKFCISHLRNFNGISADASVCHVLRLLSRILHSFPQSLLQQVCETVLSLMTLSDLVVKSVCFQTLHGMFLNRPHHSLLSPDLNARIITALYDYCPSVADAQFCPAWLAVMEKGLMNLCTGFLDSSLSKEASHLALVHFPKLFSTVFKSMLSYNSIVSKAAISTLQIIMKDGFSQIWIKKDVLISMEDENMFVSSLFNFLEDGIKYKYRDVWNLIFHITETLFEVIIKKSHFSLVKPFLESVVDMRIIPHFQFRIELDRAVGAAVGTLGPKLFLKAVPLHIDGTETDFDFPRSWFLPLLKSSIKQSELGFFFEYFVNLSSTLRERAQQFAEANRKVEENTYQMLYLQCWDLFPSFCKNSNDMSTVFPKVARLVGQTLTENTELQTTIMTGLRNLILAAKNDENNQAVMSKFAKNFLPILFNIYTHIKPISDGHFNEIKIEVDGNKRKSAERLSSLETIRLFLSITNKNLISSYFSKVQHKVFNGDESDSMRLALFDLLIIMIPYIERDLVDVIFKDMKPMLTSPNSRLQKKAYRVLEEICNSSSEPCRVFVNLNLSELKSVLLQGLSKSSPSSKGPRIKCLQQVYIQLHSNPETRPVSEAFLKAVVPEVILCTKESKRSRSAAFDFIVTAAKTCFSEQNVMALQKYFDIIFLGLTGSPMIIAATISALSRLLFELKNLLPSDLLNQTVANVCLLLGCNTAEVVQSSLGFVVLSLHVLSRETFAQHLKHILDALLNWNDSTRHRFRFTVKKILQKLVKSFGFETIYSMTPEVHKKQLDHTRKQQARFKRNAEKLKRNENDKESDDEVDLPNQKKETMEELLALSSDSDDEVQKQDNQPKKKRKTRSSAWLHETDEDPIDFLDPSTSEKIISKKPNSITKDVKSDFQTAKDGRLIITDLDLNSNDEESKIFKSIGLGAEISKIDGCEPKSKKRKFADDSDDDIFENSVPAKKSYQPGGKGIHRDRSGKVLGDTCKAKKAGGDVKRQGQHQPYAYLPFDSSILNKRKRKKLSGQFEGMVRAAKKGAAAGKKIKKKKSKRNQRLKV